VLARRMPGDVAQAPGDPDRKLSVHGSSLVSWRHCENAACKAVPAAGSYGEPAIRRPPAMRRNCIRAAATASALGLAACEQLNSYVPPPRVLVNDAGAPADHALPRGDDAGAVSAGCASG